MKLRYVVVYERTPNNYCAGAPDVPGCVAAADSWEEIQAMVREALELHLQDLAETGQPIPEPCMSLSDAMADYAKVASDDVDDGYSDYGDAVDPLEVTFSWVEVNVPDYAPVERSDAAPSRVADGS